MKNVRYALWGLIALIGVAFLLGVLLRNPNLQGTNAKENLIAVTDDVFGGPFSLTDQNGKTITEKSFEGQYKLIYFGFTYCPAICPTELSKITTALNTLGSISKKIQPIFMTVDPERDTVEKMKNYVGLFHPALVGLTGPLGEIQKTLKAYKIYAAKVQDPSLNDYTMDHSSFVYLIAPDGRLLHIFKSADTADDMAKTIQAWLTQNSRS